MSLRMVVSHGICCDQNMHITQAILLKKLAILSSRLVSVENVDHNEAHKFLAAFVQMPQLH